MGFLQPTADGGVLLVSTRKPPGAAVSAQRWSSEGELVADGDFGDAVEHVLVTDSGSVWVGYFDEALTGREPEGHGLVRFDDDLEPEWLYPWSTALPAVDDCEAMNVVGDTVYACPYSNHHLITVAGAEAKNLGPSPHRGAQALLIEDNRALLIGGYGADYDLVTLLELTAEGPKRRGGQGRLVMPDGLEVGHVRWTCRGAEAWTELRGTSYRISLSEAAQALG
ncbi:MAG: hypothetical protein QM624_08935 [Micropruina sp.]